MAEIPESTKSSNFRTLKQTSHEWPELALPSSLKILEGGALLLSSFGLFSESKQKKNPDFSLGFAEHF